jgi:NAD(P)H-hydrate epimerase
VAEPSGSAWVYPRPNPALATAGSGDVLAGLIAGLAAQGLAPIEASRLAVVTHALAAERVQQERQWRTLIASDLLPAVPRVLRELARC